MSANASTSNSYINLHALNARTGTYDGTQTPDLVLDSNGHVNPLDNLHLNFPQQLKRPLLRGSRSNYTDISFEEADEPVALSWRASAEEMLRRSIPSQNTVMFVLLCIAWYASSAASNNTGKIILNSFNYPITLTIWQFGSVALYCRLMSSRLFRKKGSPGLQKPSWAMAKVVLPMAFFQVAGHIFSSLAISKVPVSTVHTIKALSPLFTVASYRIFFGVEYSLATYISLIPLVAGVMLACSMDLSGSSVFGLCCALGSTFIFVSQNLYIKRLLPESSQNRSHAKDKNIELVNSTQASKLDKINLLYASSGLAFTLMIPIWLFYDSQTLLTIWWSDLGVTGQSAVHVQEGGGMLTAFTMRYLWLNGFVHWAQNILAFSILAMTSPVTYSIASLFKRIAVIMIAIVWFDQELRVTQGLGITLTTIGLWLYNDAKQEITKREREANSSSETSGLPLSQSSTPTRAEQTARGNDMLQKYTELPKKTSGSNLRGAFVASKLDTKPPLHVSVGDRIEEAISRPWEDPQGLRSPPPRRRFTLLQDKPPKAIAY